MAFHVDSEVGVLKHVIVHALGRSALQRAPAAGGLSSLVESEERACTGSENRSGDIRPVTRLLVSRGYHDVSALCIGRRDEWET